MAKTELQGIPVLDCEFAATAPRVGMKCFELISTRKFRLIRVSVGDRGFSLPVWVPETCLVFLWLIECRYAKCSRHSSELQRQRATDPGRPASPPRGFN